MGKILYQHVMVTANVNCWQKIQHRHVVTRAYGNYCQKILHQHVNTRGDKNCPPSQKNYAELNKLFALLGMYAICYNNN
jgi:hypothetical protein